MRFFALHKSNRTIKFPLFSVVIIELTNCAVKARVPKHNWTINPEPAYRALIESDWTNPLPTVSLERFLIKTCATIRPTLYNFVDINNIRKFLAHSKAVAPAGGTSNLFDIITWSNGRALHHSVMPCRDACRCISKSSI